MTAPSPKELSDRLEALRRTLRASGKIGTESPENYELVSILNGVAALEGLREKVEKMWAASSQCDYGDDCDDCKIEGIRTDAFKEVLELFDANSTTEPT